MVAVGLDFDHRFFSRPPFFPHHQSPSASIDSEVGAPFAALALGTAAVDAAAAKAIDLPRLRVGRARSRRRATLDGGGGESTDDAAVSVSPAW